MHFFHFPYKDAERCKKWALYSGRIEFLALPHSQLRNKTVCGEHFTDNCFMNYLKESLTRNAFPTLKLMQGHKVKVHVNEGELASLVYPVPSKQQTIDLPEKMTRRATESVDDDKTITSPPFADSDSTESGKSKILNRMLKRRLDTPEHTPLAKLSTVGPSTRVGSTDLTPIPCKQVVVKQYRSERREKDLLSVEVEKHQLTTVKNCTEAGLSSVASPNNLSQPLNIQSARTSRDSQSVDDYSNSEECGVVMNDFDDAASNDVPENVTEGDNKATSAIYKALYEQTMAEHAKQIEDLKKMLSEKLEAVGNSSQQSATVAASSSSDIRGEIKIAKGPTMTKIQLFNGIRKYLNPSMVALLRMEIFGGAEREYRPDERQIAKELYSLNASVYDYMREEWRFRLPAKAQVESWLKEPDDEDVSEFF